MSNGALFGILAAAAAGVAIAVLVNKNKKTNTDSAEVVEIDLNKLNQLTDTNNAYEVPTGGAPDIMPGAKVPGWMDAAYTKELPPAYQPYV